MGFKISARVRQSSMTSNTLRASVNFFGQITIQRYFVFVSTEELRTLYIQKLSYMNTFCEYILKQIGPTHAHFYGGEYWTKMELNKFISNRVMHYIVPCGDKPSKTTNFSVDRYTIPDTSCYCIGHAPTSYRMLLYRAWCCQIVINVRR